MASSCPCFIGLAVAVGGILWWQQGCPRGLPLVLVCVLLVSRVAGFGTTITLSQLALVGLRYPLGGLMSSLAVFAFQRTRSLERLILGRLVAEAIEEDGM